MKKETKEKPRYSMGQNTGFMVRLAWSQYKSVPLLCVAVAVLGAGVTAAQLLIGPAILDRLEAGAPLSLLVRTILCYGGILMLLTMLQSYVNENTLFGRVAVRTHLTRMIGDKLAGTSYPNLQNPRFLGMEERAFSSTGGNNKATEKIWLTWEQLLKNLLGFAAYLALLSRLDLWLIALVIVTAGAGYFVNKRVNEWNYRRREEEDKSYNQLDYFNRVATGREYAKELRLLGLGNWLAELWDRTMRAYHDFCRKRERAYLWSDLADLLLTFLRNGIGYWYLLHITLKNGLPAAQFLLYFSALSGFGAWVTGILARLSELHQESLDISVLREFLEYPEPFALAGGDPIPTPADGKYELRLEDVSFRYPEAGKDTISHLSLTIRPGEKLAIVGLNGAGKPRW